MEFKYYIILMTAFLFLCIYILFLVQRLCLISNQNVLQKCQKRKDVMGLRLLLNSVQNSIEEPWQRIPSVIALFAAEASCVLLDPAHDHYAAISTFFIHSSKLNMRVYIYGLEISFTICWLFLMEFFAFYWKIHLLQFCRLCLITFFGVPLSISKQRGLGCFA